MNENEQEFLLRWPVCVYLLLKLCKLQLHEQNVLLSQLLYYLFMVSCDEPQLSVQVGPSFLCADELQDVLVPHAGQVVYVVLILPRLLILTRKTGGMQFG